MENTWVKKNGSLAHDTLYDDQDKLTMSLYKNHGFSIQTAELAATTLPSVSAPEDKDELMNLWVVEMVRKSGRKQHETVTLPKLRNSVLFCPVTMGMRAMTEDPIPDIPFDGRPNIRHIQIPQDDTGYILGKGHETLREIQTKFGAMCFFDQHALTIHCWGAFTAVEKFDTEIKKSLMWRELQGKAGKGFSPHRGSDGKGKAGLNGPYGRAAIKGKHGKGSMEDQPAGYGGNHGPWWPR